MPPAAEIEPDELAWQVLRTGIDRFVGWNVGSESLGLRRGLILTHPAGRDTSS
jgi:hypothetical protein